MTTRRHTPQRQRILEVLRASRTHPTADRIFEAVREELPRVSLATVYRNLEALAADGLVRRIDGPGTHRRFDGNLAPHHHARCRICDGITDLYEIPDHGLERLAEQECGFAITETSIQFTGVCHSCRPSTTNQSPTR